jgi:hypothetical protein
MNEAANEALTTLQDIHAAPLPAFWPPAAGWWILTLLVLLLISLAAYQSRRYYQRWQRRRQVLRHLTELYAACQTGNDLRAFAAGLSILLRRVALTLYPRRDVAGLSHHEWLQFLDATGGRGQFQQGAGQQLVTAPYSASPQIDSDALYILARTWIKRNL